MKDTPTAIIFLDGVKDADIKRLDQLLSSEQSSKAVKNLTYVILANTGMSDALLNQQIAQSIMTTSIRRSQKLQRPNRIVRRARK